MDVAEWEAAMMRRVLAQPEAVVFRRRGGTYAAMLAAEQARKQQVAREREAWQALRERWADKADR